jgi:predicted nucleotidyltransferase
MSLPSLPTPTINCSLDEVIVRLRQHAAVDGILVMGSAADDRLTPHSDYDLLLVLDPMPVPLHLIFTQIARRLTEIYVATPAAIERVTGGDAPPRDYSYEATLVGWLQTGTIHFDHNGRLAAAQARARHESAIRPQGERGVYGAWFNVSYNLQQTRRILRAGDPVSLISVDLRLLHTIHALWLDYFLIRRLAGRSEKDQIRYLQAHDPHYLALFQRFMAEGDRDRKMALYEQLARLTVAPVGELLPPDATMLHPDDASPWGFAEAERGLHFWQELIAGEDRDDA